MERHQCRFRPAVAISPHPSGQVVLSYTTTYPHRRPASPPGTTDPSPSNATLSQCGDRTDRRRSTSGSLYSAHFTHWLGGSIDVAVRECSHFEHRRHTCSRYGAPLNLGLE